MLVWIQCLNKEMLVGVLDFEKRGRGVRENLCNFTWCLIKTEMLLILKILIIFMKNNFVTFYYVHLLHHLSYEFHRFPHIRIKSAARLAAEAKNL